MVVGDLPFATCLWVHNVAPQIYLAIPSARKLLVRLHDDCDELGLTVEFEALDWPYAAGS